MCLMEKISVLDKLCSSMNYNAIGCEFNVSELTMYILNKAYLNRNTYKTNLCINWLMKML